MNWIKICHATPTKSEVRTIARSLKVSRSHVFGALVTVWIWADQELTPGSNTISGDLDLIDEVGDLPGLAEAMIKVNWLTQVEGGFAFPNIERHLSETAKARALGAARVAKHRIKTPEEKPNRPLPEPCNGRALQGVTVERYKKPKPVTVQRYQRREEEEKNREEIREEESGSAPPTATAETDKPILRFPIQGANGMDAKRDWHLSRDQVERFRELFPTVDVLAECRKALAWVEADPKRRKTAGGYPRYLTGWLNRTAETKAGPGQVAQAVGPNGKPLNEIERLSMEMFGEVF